MTIDVKPKSTRKAPVIDILDIYIQASAFDFEQTQGNILVFCSRLSYNDVSMENNKNSL